MFIILDYECRKYNKYDETFKTYCIVLSIHQDSKFKISIRDRS